MKNRFFHTILTFLLGIGGLWAQQGTELSCLQVNADGSVTLWFDAPSDFANVLRYDVFYSPNGSGFSLAGTLPGGNSGLQSFTHPGALAGSGSRFYYLETVYNSTTVTSQTRQTIYLQLDNNAPDFNQADLYWNAVSTPLPGGSLSTYDVLWDYPSGNWQSTGQTDNTQFSLPVIVCNDSINFRIEIANNAGCSSVSNVRGDWFKNVEEPDMPVIDSISVDANGHVILGWESVSNAAAYIIYRWEGIWKPVDTVYGLSTTFYTDTLTDACNNTYSYSVATIDTCGSSGPKDENKERRSIRIDTVFHNTCQATVTLRWTPYRVPQPDLYRIWYSENGSSLQLLAEVTTPDSVFVHQNVSGGTDYSYFVQAIFSGGSSSTCLRSIRTHDYVRPGFLYLANADVLPSQEIELTAEVDLGILSGSWDIYRTDPGTSVPQKIATVNRSETSASPLLYTDGTADPASGPYTYFVRALDSCGFETLESNSLTSIHLQGEILDKQTNRLFWTAFEGWDAPVEKYFIYRMIGNTPPTAPIDSVDAQTFEYIDDFSALGDVDGRFVYWVQAREQQGDSYGFREASRSNRLPLYLESQVFFPNAFKPDGINSEFKPVFRFFSGTAYRFQIYNRWGQLIFETEDFNEGWTGDYNDEPVDKGVYIYRLSYQDVYNRPVLLRGTVMLLR